VNSIKATRWKLLVIVIFDVLLFYFHILSFGCKVTHFPANRQVFQCEISLKLNILDVVGGWWNSVLAFLLLALSPLKYRQNKTPQTAENLRGNCRSKRKKTKLPTSSEEGWPRTGLPELPV
jgi:hypothetical protein